MSILKFNLTATACLIVNIVAIVIEINSKSRAMMREMVITCCISGVISMIAFVSHAITKGKSNK